METDPEEEHNPMLEDNARSGKRKRSIDTNSQSPPNWSPADQGDPTKDVPRRRISKKPRAGALAPGTDVAPEGITFLERARSFLLPPFPVEILQHIMSFIDPFSLGRLMSVNRYLHSLLNPHQNLSRPPGLESKLPYLTADSLWRCSRRAYEPGIPPPLKHKTELEMFNLIYGKRCQICGFFPKAPSSRLSEGPWNSGPGPRGVRTIWPFKTRLCANCLKNSIMKEAELLKSEHSHLRIGLLSASFTPSLHYVMSMTLAQTPVPTGLNITNYYFQPQIEETMRSAPSTQTPGNAAYELWFQQLDASRQEAVTDVSRLEAWELAQKANSDTLAVPFNLNSRSSASGSSIHSDNLTKSHFTTSSGGFRPPLSSRSGLGSSTLSSSFARHDIGPSALLRRLDHTAGRVTPMDVSRPTPNSQPVGQPAHIQSSDPRLAYGSTDILKLKSDKRAEIQRRCLDLDPPIHSSVLDHLPAYHSALGVLMPLDENSWEKLRVQLLNERHTAELFRTPSHTNQSYTDSMDTATIGRVATPSAEPIEEDLRKQAFRPVREKLVDFAREYVHSRYAGGFGLTYSSAPQFAADVLIYVRQRFYENQDREDAEFALYGQQPPDEGPNGIRTRTLRLEHMRYVFEHAIRPYTELVRKDLFLCSACDTQGRHFAFEAIIQHFASKHTNAFSRGNAVVYWKTEWPAQPPFEPEPGRDIEPPITSYLASTPGLPGTTEERLLSNPVAFPSSSADVASLYAGRHSYLSPSELHDNIRYAEPIHSAGRHEPGTTLPTPYQSDLPPLWPRHASSEPYMLEADSYPTPVVRTFIRNPSSFQNNDNLSEHRYRLEARPSTEAPPAQVRRYVDSTDESSMYHALRPEYQMIPASPRHAHGDAQTLIRSSHRPVERISFHEPTAYDTRTDTSQDLLVTNFRADSLSRPRLSEERRNHESSRDRSRASSARYFRDFNDQQSLPSVTAETPAYSAAERFLESFDVPATAAHNKRPSRPGSVEQFPRPVSREGTAGTGMTLDRRSNTSQPRRQTRFPSDLEHDRLRNTRVANSERPYEQHGSEFTSTTRAHRGQELSYERFSMREDAYQRELRYPGPSTERVIVYDEHPASAREPNIREPFYYVQRSPTANRYTSDTDPTYPGSRLVEPTYYAGTRAERTQHLEESQAPELYYEEGQYERQRFIIEPETRSYYVQRPEREYIPRYRRVEYERSPHREIIFDNDDRYHEGGGPSISRAPHRYERH